MEWQAECGAEMCRSDGRTWRRFSSGLLGSALGNRGEGGCGLRYWQFEGERRAFYGSRSGANTFRLFSYFIFVTSL